MAKTAILSLPQGWGKTQIANDVAQFLGCSDVVDEWHPGRPILAGALHLTHVSMVAEVAA